jgi:hypothetical protein
VNIYDSPEQRRESHARAYLAWRRSIGPEAVTRGDGKPPAMFGLPAVGGKSRPRPRKASVPKARRRRSVPTRATTAQHNAMMRRLYGKSWRPMGQQ